jgi:hypothetical protein
MEEESGMSVDERPAGASAPSLERDAIGLPEVLFQSITHMAPAVATALSIGAATSFAGGITPLAVLFAMIAVLFTAFSTAELAEHLPSAGGCSRTSATGSACSSAGSLLGFALAEPLVMPLLLGASALRCDLPLDVPGHQLEYAWLGLWSRAGSRSGSHVSRHRNLDAHRPRPGIVEIVIFLLVSALLIERRPEHPERVPSGADGSGRRCRA